MELELISEQEFDIYVRITGIYERDTIAYLPAMSRKIIEIPEDSREINILFCEEERPWLFVIEIFLQLFTCIVEFILIFLEIWSTDNTTTEQLGGDEENLIDTKIVLKEDSKEEKVKIVYKRSTIKENCFNLGEVQGGDSGILVKYIANKEYRRKVRMLMAGYLLYALGGVLVLGCFLYILNKESHILLVLFAVITGSILYFYITLVVREYRKWRDILQ